MCRRGGPAGGRPGGPAPAHAHAAPRGLLVHGVRRPAARSMLAGACCHTCSGSRARWARAGAATCPARRRRACGRSCALAAPPRATARRRARRLRGARATGARASACERAPDRRVAGPPTLLRRMQARALLGAAHVDMRQRAAAQRRAQRGSSAQAGLSARSPRAARWDRRISRLLLVAGTVTLVAVRRTGACELAPARPTLLLAPAAVSARDAGARWRLFYGERPGQVPCTGGALHLQSARAGDTW